MSDNTKLVLDIGEKCNSATTEAVQMAILTVAKTAKDPSHNHSTATYISCMASLGAMMPGAMAVSKCDFSREQIEHFRENEDAGQKAARSLVTPEALLFVSILAAKILVSFDVETGYQTTEFGPHILFEALEVFEAAIGKPADAYLDPNLLKAARTVGASSAAPFRDFLKGRSTPPTTDTLQ